MSTWQNLERDVREIASLIWMRDAQPERIGGVDVDCVIKISNEHYVLIEITEERNLNKVRTDVTKLETARATLLVNPKISARCICVIGAEDITTGMVDAGKERNIEVMSLALFKRIFFDYPSYYKLRSTKQFGSSFNPVTNSNDTREYTPVTYLLQDRSKEIKIPDICEYLRRGQHVIMVGEYGSGKSRCVREIFNTIGKDANLRGHYPIAVDLRENWGLKRATEIIRRHFEDLGLNAHAEHLLRGLQSDHFIFLLDGFDELGSQFWSNDNAAAKNSRSQSLAGVRDLINKSLGGILICGREHYFNSDEEMLNALGIKRDKAVIIRSKDEFTEEEMGSYLGSFIDDFTIPSWIPKRPLICQVIASLPEEDVGRMFGDAGGDIEFWQRFMKVLCDRDANIREAFFDPQALYGVLKYLARITRAKPENVGPITLGETQKAFEAVVGEMPIEQATAMLQRLPGLGRIKAETTDRQFIDTYILDGLRGEDVIDIVNEGDASVEKVAWQNSLERLGQRIIAREIDQKKSVRKFLHVANRCASNSNRVLACDIVAAICLMDAVEFDFNGLAIDDGHFSLLDLSNIVPKNLRISNSFFTELALPSSIPAGTQIKSSLCQRVYGVSSAKGLPSWIDVEVENFIAVNNVASIRKMGLTPGQEILVTVVRKTFFQKGNGRKEEALLRGLGKIATAATANKILNRLIGDELLEKIKGSEGWIYVPNRAYAGRMGAMLNELNVSDDPIWRFASEL